jgi:hypothetical protein
MFDEVTVNRPWYYWFKQGKDVRVYRVIRDHIGGLWVSQYGHSTSMRIWLLGRKCLGPVEPPIEPSIPVSNNPTMELEIIFPNKGER